MQRSILAIVAGFFATFIAVQAGTAALKAIMPDRVRPAGARVDDPVVLVATLAIVAVCAIAGCYLTAKLAPRQPMKHALLLGAIAFAMSIPLTIQVWQLTPVWYNLYSLAAVMPYAWLGGKLAGPGAPSAA